MFSEGAMSVVESEVMPLEYGGMDSESSPSPSSLKKTVEERRERGVVEEEEEIPSNIMEVEGNVGRCYDPELDIVSEVRGYASELGSRSSFRGLVNNCNLPHHVLIRPAGVNERACSAPRDYWMPMYVRDGNLPRSPWGPVGILVTGTGRGGIFLHAGRDAEVEQLSAWKAKKTKHNNYKLNEDEVEEVGKLVREEGELVDIMYLTNAEAIKAVELYGPSSLSEVEMDGFLNAAEGLAIPKKPRKKSKTSTTVEKGAAARERLSSTSARALEMQQRPKPIRRSKPEARGDEVVEFVPRPPLAKVDPEVREREEAEVRGPGKGKELIPPPSFQKSLFNATNITGAKRFLNAILPKVDKRQAREEASASWVNALAQEYAESVRDRSSLQRQCEELLKEKKELQKKNKKMQRKLDEVLPSITKLQTDRDTLSTRLVFEERKRKICEDKIEAQDKYIEKMNKGMAKLKKNVDFLVHNGMEEHIGNFLNSSTFENIVNLYQLPTIILAFTNCRKKVKAQYPEVDVTTVTFGEQEEVVEEDDESLSANFRPLIKLRWERDVEGRIIFPPAFDAELVAVEEEEEA
ncbi:hypothetical protein SLEP1_g42392 [Rubroshorea leprosula]|uniref:Uncharacterized protein n=1 Tax=Rubroshorea leprosula TaxID=152421 RepID=A0AAV5LB29_9ROSI|nr:hypothetical protein SLEP1_g42392 [Rubroshorea leprosula]